MRNAVHPSARRSSMAWRRVTGIALLVGGLGSAVTPALRQTAVVGICPALGDLLATRLAEIRVRGGFPGATAAVVLDDGAVAAQAAEFVASGSTCEGGG